MTAWGLRSTLPPMTFASRKPRRSPLPAVGPAIVLALAVALPMALLPGCANVETVKAAQGQGATRSYPHPRERVIDATLAAAKARELDVVEADRASGRLILSKGVTWWSWGERIAVFVKPLDAASTQVEIVSKPVMAPLNFPPDWQTILLDQIATELGRGR